MSEPVVLEHDGVIEAPTWFGPGDRPLLGWFTYPRSQRVRGAVVLCQPIAEEGNMAYRTFRTLAQRLAADGFLSIRFDYDGTGDSAGSFEDTHRAEAWVASVREAVCEARRWGTENVSVIGMRMGATLAYVAAAEGGLDLNDLVLWDPCVTGRGFLRELQLVHSVFLEGRRTAPSGWVETPSYRFTPEAASGIRALAVDGRASVDDLARRTTVVARVDRPRATSLLAALPTETASWIDAGGQAELLDVPTLHASVPEQTVDTIVARLSASAPEPAVDILPRLQPRARWNEDGVELEEEACLFGPDRLLFGVKTTGIPQHQAGPRIAMFNVAAERHLGEGRTWVRIARALARDGATSVRVDHGGVGDSGTRPGHTPDTVYDEGWIDDVRDVVEELSDNRRHEVIGVGLCSSGTSVLQATVTGALREAIVVNVVFDTDLNTALPPAWTLFPRKPSWLRRFAVRHKRQATLLWKAWGVVDPRRDPMWTTARAVSRGVDLTVVGGPEDLARMRHSALWRLVWGRPLSSERRFRVEPAPDADHSLRVSAGQDEVVKRVSERVRTRLRVRS
ncbi:serine aminopeptidase domain-containing protein [Rathayibacter sp. KR2-224]|uniref:serine aminopeptidase domain-containing protein n=1 Tax=Rathayibacter sp. KR2-224 TaxID=3400913 RepID=UPI003C073EE6